MSLKVKLDFKGVQPQDLERRLKSGIRKAFDEVVPDLDREFTVKIQAPEYFWPRQTKRKNGSTAYQVRNIVDLGDLMRSQQNQKINNYTWEWRWTVDYSAVVHNGATMKSGSKYPPRPWTKRAALSIAPAKIISDTIRRELDG